MDDLRVLCRLLIDAEALRGASCDGDLQRRVWQLATASDSHLCLAWRLRENAVAWDAPLLAAARAALADAAVLEEVRRHELVAVTALLAAAGVDALLLKGSALAYQVYAHPMLRPRDDTDLFVRAADADRAAEALVASGYVPAQENTAALATAQRHFRRVDQRRVEHPLDLHWRVTNPLVFAGALPFGRARERSVAIAGLGGARGLCRIDALMLACLHRVAHHGDDSSLIWMFDIHQLAAGLPTAGWEELVDEAARNALGGACASGLSRSAALFGTDVPAGVLERLAATTRPGERAFSGAQVSALGMLVSDWHALDSWGGRMRLLGAHLFPNRAYMASKYGTNNTALLPFLYAHRALTGLPRWIRR